jgi:hypothetical protein
VAGGGTKNYGYIHFSVFLNYGDAVLDVPLSKHLAAGKLFVGQKLRVVCSFLLFFFYPSLSRTFPLELSIVYSLFCPVQIWGAELCGWVGPVSPLGLFLCVKFMVAYLIMRWVMVGTRWGIWDFYPIVAILYFLFPDESGAFTNFQEIDCGINFGQSDRIFWCSFFCVKCTLHFV